MSTVLARRLGRLEASARADAEQRWKAAQAQLFALLAADHKRSIYDWAMRAKLSSPTCVASHGGFTACVRCIESSDPPALGRALWATLVGHVECGAPLVFPPDVAQVYVDHADAVPAIACTGCGYLLPARRGQLAFAGPCPGCGTTVSGQSR